MTSYDVTSLYPSVPVDDSIGYIKEWLEENNVSREWIEMYLDFTRVCMNQNVFIFKGKIYRQTFGVAMGNSLSCFVAEVFMCHFETKIEKDPLFPRIYHRFVDDIFSITNKRKIDMQGIFLNLLLYKFGRLMWLT